MATHADLTAQLRTAKRDVADLHARSATHTELAAAHQLVADAYQALANATGTYELQCWDWATSTWETHATYTGPDGRDNAHYSAQLQRASRTGPIRLLLDGQPVMADDPNTYYDRED